NVQLLDFFRGQRSPFFVAEQILGAFTRKLAVTGTGFVRSADDVTIRGALGLLHGAFRQLCNHVVIEGHFVVAAALTLFARGGGDTAVITVRIKQILQGWPGGVTRSFRLSVSCGFRVAVRLVSSAF